MSEELKARPGVPLPLAGRRDFMAGFVLVIIAIAITIAAFDLRIGTPARMGPGFLPLALGILLAAVGLSVMVSACYNIEPRPTFQNLRPLAALLAGFIAFALLIDDAGLALAAFAAVFLASFAAPGRQWFEAGLFAAALSAFAIFVFIVVLDMPLQVWP